MPTHVQSLLGSKVEGSDGKAGSLSDLLMDDREWKVRYLVIVRGIWPFRRRVVVLPKHVESTSSTEGIVKISLSQSQTKAAPRLSARRPVSHLKEKEFHDYYQVPVYWSGTAAWEETYDPGAMPKSGGSAGEERKKTDQELFENHLRSADRLLGYDVKAEDQAMGQVKDFILGQSGWQVERLLVYRREEPRELTVSTESIRQVSWIEKTIRVDASADFDEHRG
jgi:uncharacterized protein YrrD